MSFASSKRRVQTRYIILKFEKRVNVLELLDRFNSSKIEKLSIYFSYADQPEETVVILSLKKQTEFFYDLAKNNKITAPAFFVDFYHPSIGLTPVEREKSIYTMSDDFWRLYVSTEPPKKPSHYSFFKRNKYGIVDYENEKSFLFYFSKFNSDDLKDGTIAFNVFDHAHIIINFVQFVLSVNEKVLSINELFPKFCGQLENPYKNFPLLDEKTIKALRNHQETAKNVIAHANLKILSPKEGEQIENLKPYNPSTSPFITIAEQAQSILVQPSEPVPVLPKPINDLNTTDNPPFNFEELSESYLEGVIVNDSVSKINFLKIYSTESNILIPRLQKIMKKHDIAINSTSLKMIRIIAKDLGINDSKMPRKSDSNKWVSDVLDSLPHFLYVKFSPFVNKQKKQ